MAVFVWLFHRISGVLLLFLLVLQFFTGFLQASPTQAESLRSTAALHRHAALNCLLVFLVIFHGLYGLRTILLDFGLRRERFLFWICTVLGTVLFAVFLVFYLTQLAP